MRPAPVPLPPRRHRRAAAPLRAVAAAWVCVAAVVMLSVPASAQAGSGPTTPTTTPTTAPAAPTTTAPATAVAGPDPAVLQALAAAQRAEAVAAAEADAAQRRALAEQLAVEETTAEAAHTDALSRLEASERAATDAHDELERRRRRQVTLAVHAYQQVGTEADLDMASWRRRWVRDDAVRRQYAGAAARSVTRSVAAARDELRRRHEAVVADRDAVRAADDAVRQARERRDAAVADQQRAEAEVEAVRRGERDPLQVLAPDTGLQRSGGPTILGPSLLTWQDLARYARERGGVNPKVDIDAVARAFISEGAAEGVRGDIAFAQSIVETGNFSFRNSMVDPEDHNYAGIGACDSCSDGFGFPSEALGVRAQMQLLRAYADPTVTSETLAHPPVRTRPEKLGVRGCCWTWTGLNGVWATGANYGQKILSVYDRMTRSALAARQAAGTTPTTATTLAPAPGTPAAPGTVPGAP